MLESNLTWLSPNSIQILDNISCELNEIPSPTDLMDTTPFQPNLIEEENKLACSDSQSPNTLDAMLSEL